jgi:pSer/pThr/pTyr-binding forkhead associated (FHA) protein
VSELTLFLLQLAFLGLLWAFIFAIVYALRTDLFGPPRYRQDEETREPAKSSTNQTPPLSLTPATPGGVAQNLVVTAGPKEGLDIELLPEEQFTFGRSGDSSLVIRDDVTSTHHARLMLWNDQWMIQDLDSTNGTFVDGKRVSIPTPVPLNTPVRIGNTVFELRR